MSADPPPLMTRPINSKEKILQEKFAATIASQSDKMDKLGQQLIVLELAIPGLYATVLQLTQGKDATLTVNGWFYFTFACWFIALLLTLASLIPRKWKVDPTILRQDPAVHSDKIGIEDFFRKSAAYKLRLLIIASIFFWAGILGSALLIF